MIDVDGVLAGDDAADTDRLLPDRGAIRSSMNLMSDGMAVAMYTTLAGLVGSILVRIQYYMLDDATAKLFAYAVSLTEARVVSILEDQPGAAE
jgi:hypothetical protein